jgi:tRNA(fMet)-specific endonuclease VapC
MIRCLDTNICIYALKGIYPSIPKYMNPLMPSSIKIPSMVRAELLLGGEKSQTPKKALELIEKFLFPFDVLAFDLNASDVYAKIRAATEKKGHSVGPNDLIIAATCLAHHGTLVTHNTKEFKRIPGLQLEDWTRSRT